MRTVVLLKQRLLELARTLEAVAGHLEAIEIQRASADVRSVAKELITLQALLEELDGAPRTAPSG